MRYTRLTGLHHRRLFDPERKEDLLEFKYFLEHNKWQGACPFFLEDSWDNVPAMCKDKYTRLMLKSLNKKPR